MYYKLYFIKVSNNRQLYETQENHNCVYCYCYHIDHFVHCVIENDRVVPRRWFFSLISFIVELLRSKDASSVYSVTNVTLSPFALIDKMMLFRSSIKERNDESSFGMKVCPWTEPEKESTHTIDNSINFTCWKDFITFGNMRLNFIFTLQIYYNNSYNH